MSAVELRRRRPVDAGIETLARIHVPRPGGPAVIDPVGPVDRASLEAMLAEGGVIGADGRELRPADGQAYVEALPSSFRGSRLWAEAVEDHREG